MCCMSFTTPVNHIYTYMTGTWIHAQWVTSNIHIYIYICVCVCIAKLQTWKAGTTICHVSVWSHNPTTCFRKLRALQRMFSNISLNCPPILSEWWQPVMCEVTINPQGPLAWNNGIIIHIIALQRQQRSDFLTRTGVKTWRKFPQFESNRFKI